MNSHANSFARRFYIATRWLTNAGMESQIDALLDEAADFAGSNEQEFLAYIAWKIKAYQVAQGGK